MSFWNKSFVYITVLSSYKSHASKAETGVDSGGGERSSGAFPAIQDVIRGGGDGKLWSAKERSRSPDNGGGGTKSLIHSWVRGRGVYLY
uniref:Uncharacterized protein n=1 Tax=Picea glauca TaxID=3330 RepID=A0A101M1A2_PICGL|nr:hypothetical protein ABT39_MTgene4426 [Picea glauca]